MYLPPPQADAVYGNYLNNRAVDVDSYYFHFLGDCIRDQKDTEEVTAYETNFKLRVSS